MNRILVANISFWDIGYFALDVVVNFSELPKKICCWLPCSWSGVWKSCEDICIKDRIAKFANISLDEDSTRLKSIQLTSRSKFDRWWMSSEQNKQTNLDKTAKLLVFLPPIFDESKRLSFSIPLTLLCLAACPKNWDCAPKQSWFCSVIDVQRSSWWFMMLPSHFNWPQVYQQTMRRFIFPILKGHNIHIIQTPKNTQIDGVDRTLQAPRPTSFEIHQALASPPLAL